MRNLAVARFSVSLYILVGNNASWLYDMLIMAENRGKALEDGEA